MCIVAHAFSPSTWQVADLWVQAPHPHPWSAEQVLGQQGPHRETPSQGGKWEWLQVEDSWKALLHLHKVPASVLTTWEGKRQRDGKFYFGDWVRDALEATATI